MNPAIGVFPDASVLLAAAGSPTGGSSAALEIITTNARYEALASPDVLIEARGNVVSKFSVEAGARLVVLLSCLRPRVVQPGDAADPETCPPASPITIGTSCMPVSWVARSSA